MPTPDADPTAIEILRAKMRSAPKPVAVKSRAPRHSLLGHEWGDDRAQGTVQWV